METLWPGELVDLAGCLNRSLASLAIHLPGAKASVALGDFGLFASLPSSPSTHSDYSVSGGHRLLLSAAIGSTLLSLQFLGYRKSFELGLFRLLLCFLGSPEGPSLPPTEFVNSVQSVVALETGCFQAFSFRAPFHQTQS